MIELLIAVVLFVVILIVAIKWYTIVPADKADVVVQAGKTRVFSAHADYRVGTTKASYFKIPEWVFLLHKGMKVHRMPLSILPIHVEDFLAFDEERARFVCDIVAYVSIHNPIKAAQRFSGKISELEQQVSKVVQATTRDATTKKKIREIINDREGLIAEIEEPLGSAISNWGLSLNEIELVEFKDPKGVGGVDSHVIADISSITEVQIESEARQKNAEQKKLAKVKEAQADEDARKREIERDEVVAKREQDKNRLVAEQQKLAREKELDVERVQEVKTAEIEKEKQVVIANQEKEVAKIEAARQKEVEAVMKEQKKLEGEGDRIRAEAQAKGAAARTREQKIAEADGEKQKLLAEATGDAAKVREKLLAEAEGIEKRLLAEARGKEKLQQVLSKFDDDAIRAFVAKELVEKDRAIGIAFAQALENADVKAFLGGDKSDKESYNIGRMMMALQIANSPTADAVLNRAARPNDLGLTALGLGSLKDRADTSLEEELEEVEEEVEETEDDTEDEGYQ
jgi:flotillin